MLPPRRERRPEWPAPAISDAKVERSSVGSPSPAPRETTADDSRLRFRRLVSSCKRARYLPFWALTNPTSGDRCFTLLLRERHVNDPSKFSYTGGSPSPPRGKHPAPATNNLGLRDERPRRPAAAKRHGLRRPCKRGDEPRGTEAGRHRLPHLTRPGAGPRSRAVRLVCGPCPSPSHHETGRARQAYGDQPQSGDRLRKYVRGTPPVEQEQSRRQPQSLIPKDLDQRAAVGQQETRMPVPVRHLRSPPARQRHSLM